MRKMGNRDKEFQRLLGITVKERGVQLGDEDKNRDFLVFDSYPPVDIREMDCCGVIEISSDPSHEAYSKKRFEEWLKFGLSSGALIATATRRQNEWIKWLREVGFEKVKTFFNPNSGNTVTMFLYVLSERKPRRKNASQPSPIGAS